MKLYLAIGFLAAYGLFSGYMGYQLCSGKEAKKDVKVIVNDIEKHNKDIKHLQDDTTKVQGEKEKAKQHNERIKIVYRDSVCPVSEFERLWNQTKFTRKD